MATIYLDHNVIVSIGGIPAVATAEVQRAHAAQLRQRGVQFALSAWNMYELARSRELNHVFQCAAFVDELAPVWVSCTSTVKAQEVGRYLQPVFDLIGPVRT